MSLPDEEIDGVEALIRFMYESNDLVPDPWTEHALLAHVEVHRVPDKYKCVGLKRAAAQKFAAITRAHWRSSAFVESIKSIYSAPARSNQDLRDIVFNTALEHAHRFISAGQSSMTPGAGKHSGPFISLLEEEGGLSEDIIIAMLKYDNHIFTQSGPNNPMMVELKCNQCSGIWRQPKINNDFQSMVKACPSCDNNPKLSNDYVANGSPAWVEPRDLTKLFYPDCKIPIFFLGHDIGRCTT